MPIYKGSEKIKDIVITGQNTNCITHIPQDIKLTLSNGTLTLKAGSVLTDPQGGTQRITTQDQTGTFTTNGQYMVFVDRATGALQFGSGNDVAKMGSGSTLPADGSTFRVFYNSTDGKIYRWNGSVWTVWNVAFPLGIITVSNGVISSIDQVFNGFGYIGSTIFALPGVKGLIPNGLNSDGSLKNFELTLDGVKTRTTPGASNLFMLGLSGELEWTADKFHITSSLPAAGSAYERCFVIPENQMYFHTAGSTTWTKTYYVIAGNMSKTQNGVVTSLTPKKVESPFKPVHIDKVYKGSTLVYQGAYKANQVVFEKATAGTYSVNLEKAGLYEITVVGGGGAAAMRGVYDDKGYGWTGGSGGAFVGTFVLERGTRTVVVGKANNNTTAQSGNTQTLNPTDTKTYGSSVSGVVSVGGGGSGHYNSNYVGAAGAAATLTMTPTSTTLNKAGNAGVSGSGGKGGGAGATINGGASVYNGYGKGQGCVTSEYAAKRSWINGTAGYVKIVYKGRRP